MPISGAGMSEVSMSVGAVMSAGVVMSGGLAMSRGTAISRVGTSGSGLPDIGEYTVSLRFSCAPLRRSSGDLRRQAV